MKYILHIIMAKFVEDSVLLASTFHVNFGYRRTYRQQRKYHYVLFNVNSPLIYHVLFCCSNVFRQLYIEWREETAVLRLVLSIVWYSFASKCIHWLLCSNNPIIPATLKYHCIQYVAIWYLFITFFFLILSNPVNILFISSSVAIAFVAMVPGFLMGELALKFMYK